MLRNLKYTLVIVLACLLYTHAGAQTNVSDTYRHDQHFSDSLKQIVRAVGMDKNFDVGEDGTEQISLAVIDLNGDRPVLGGVNDGNFIYPASVYKMYVAMEVLKQVSLGTYSLYAPYIVKAPNDVDQTKEISYDPRDLLRAGDTVTLNYLLDLMITRSDNSAANCLIDVASRDRINKTMHEYGWYGSEVTRKYLKRQYEDPGYDTIRGTATSALHAADFMYKIEQNQLVDPWVSMQMKSLLGRQLDTTKLATGLPRQAMFYHKTGWWSYYTHDAGIVDDGYLRYIIAFFTPLTEEEVRPKMKEISRRVYELIKNRHLR